MNEEIYKNYTSTSTNISDLNIQIQINHTISDLKEIFKKTNIRFNKNLKVLDLACGWGNHLLSLKKMGFEDLIGVDLSHEQVNLAHKYGLDNVIEGDIISFLSSCKEKFDLVILFDILEHLDNQTLIQLLKLLPSVLNDKAKILIRVPNGSSLICMPYFGDITHLRAFNVQSLTQVLKIANFSNFAFFNTTPHSKNLKGLITTLIWKLLVYPMSYLVMLALYGASYGGIYSGNILAVVNYED